MAISPRPATHYLQTTVFQPVCAQITAMLIALASTGIGAFLGAARKSYWAYFCGPNPICIEVREYKVYVFFIA